jgi:hypothetical protein
MVAVGLVMKSRRCRDSLSTLAQSVQYWIEVPRKTGAFGLACATLASTDRPPYVGLRALPARGSLRDLRSE